MNVAGVARRRKTLGRTVEVAGDDRAALEELLLPDIRQPRDLAGVPGTTILAGDRPNAMPIRRSLVVRDSVVTVSETGVKASSLATLAERGWVAFPPPAEPRP